MPEISERLRTAMGDRYAIERELGAGGMATVCRRSTYRPGMSSALARRCGTGRVGR